MPTRPSKKRRNQLDPVELVRKIVDQAVGDAAKESPPNPEEGKNRAAVALGKLGGSKGGQPARTNSQSHLPVYGLPSTAFLDTFLADSASVRRSDTYRSRSSGAAAGFWRPAVSLGTCVFR